MGRLITVLAVLAAAVGASNLWFVPMPEWLVPALAVLLLVLLGIHYFPRKRA